MDSIDERLEKIKQNLQNTSKMKLENTRESQKQIQAVDQLREDYNTQEFTKIMITVLTQVNKGRIVEVFKRDEKYYANIVPPMNNWLLFSLIANALLVTILITKVIGIW